MDDQERRPAPFGVWTQQPGDRWDPGPDEEVAVGTGVFHVKRMLTMGNYHVIDHDAPDGVYGLAVGPAPEPWDEYDAAVTSRVPDPARISPAAGPLARFNLGHQQTHRQVLEAVAAFLGSDGQGCAASLLDDHDIVVVRV